jgi:hypothetical protein
MELYEALKWRKEAQEHEQAYLASEPPITPGHYGNIPHSFSVHLGGIGDFDNAYYYLCEPGPQPLFAVSGYTGARVVTLHQNTDLKSAPLAYVTVPKVGFHLRGSITLPAPPGSRDDVVSLPFDGSGGVTSPVYQFEATVGGTRAEMFAWQQVGTYERGKPRMWELTRNVSSEKVARWQEEVVSAEGKMATFQMLGSGTSGELGEHLKLAAVVSVLAVARMDWAAEKAADQMIERGERALGRMATMGVGFAS